ncbi:16S rRNA (uracil(1498)-N(3))-methyltransferase [Bacillus thermotolerans]|uniref:Ribosomal RNA small subunit methyltransferase E n=1 Tax=Bacillus thermotolerans TaxID=1221996 RepID=A0A0F5HSR6_BACTR|nr:16S rRNA (uracil(1498)-N(3))-methyltransferase [Bacillus thermotolerans]KKB36419.1 Ribosomal RNA small subunit methyltransferase E [Bacillus thermotolerans]KKB43195.1 Ribosomal RNA small subunit methyltransferase E [Bacillus thermotolerans]KKB43598.1 Ribosomal RNA small subunit methyltransferase E [Bacillus thermotolerans]
MQRYFLQQHPGSEGTVRIEGEDFHHLAHVMRLKEGDRVYAVFPDHISAEVEIEEIAKDYALAFVAEWVHDEKELPIAVTIASGLPKGDKFELIVQKGTELGASRFVPFHADRSIVKWDEKKAAKKAERWRKIAKEAAEQSHRTLVPEVDQPVSLQQLIEMSQAYRFKLYAFEEESKQGEKTAFHRMLSDMKQNDKLFIVFGPEGGITEKEAKKLSEEGFIPCGLGPRILRAETAPLYALSAISYHFELMR